MQHLLADPKVRKRSGIGLVGLFFAYVIFFVIATVRVQPTINPVDAQESEFRFGRPTEISFTANQHPTFQLSTDNLLRVTKIQSQAKEFHADNGTIKASLIHDGGSELAIVPVITSKGEKSSDEFTIAFPTLQEVTGGKFTLKVEITSQNNQSRTITQDFYWGVLAMNLDKSTYYAGEKASIGMAVLDNAGHTLCDATLKLIVTKPDGKNIELSSIGSEPVIKVSETCEDRKVTNTPDYFANYAVDQKGEYSLHLEAETKNGKRIQDQKFSVVEQADFITHRYDTSMRIYPQVSYDVTTEIAINKDFQGGITEKVPGSFEIKNPTLTITHDNNASETASPPTITSVPSGSPLVSSGNECSTNENVSLPTDSENQQNGEADQQTSPPAETPECNAPESTVKSDIPDPKHIVWEGLSLKNGDRAVMKYTYVPPPISPEFYLLGPLEIWRYTLGETANGEVEHTKIFEEPRAWQIAADAVAGNGVLLYGDTTNAGTPKIRTLTNPDTFAAEFSMDATSASNIAWSVAHSAPTRDEIIVGTIKVDGRMDIQQCTGGCDAATDDDSDTPINKTGVSPAMTCDTTTLGSCFRPFDVAYERLSGKAMVAFGLDATTGTLQYCSWNGSAWSPTSCTTPSTYSLSSGNCGTALTGSLRWVRLIPRGYKNKGTRSNEILAVVEDSNNDIAALIWDGSSWGNCTLITATVGPAASAPSQAFDGAWENTTGNAMVIWADGTTADTTPLQYKRWTRSNTTWDSSGTNLPATTNSRLGIWVRMATAEISGKNHIAIASTIASTSAATTSDTVPYIWDGSTMTKGTEWGAGETVLAPQTGVAVESQNTDVEAFYVGTLAAAADQAGYETWVEGTGFSGGGSDNLAGTTGDMVDDTGNLDVFAGPNSNDIWILGRSITMDLAEHRWDGSAPKTAGWATGLETALAPGSTATTHDEAQSETMAIRSYSPWSRNWRFYDDETSVDPSTGLNSAAENATPTDVDPEEVVRLRMQFTELSNQAQTDSRKKLQYTSGCTPNSSETGCTWYDVLDSDATTATWRYATNAESCNAAGCADGATSTTSRLTGSGGNTPKVTFMNDKDAAADTDFDHNALQVLEVDYGLKAENVTYNTTYYFRAYDIDQSAPVLRRQDSGTTDCLSSTCTYPSLTIVNPSFTQNDYQWYSNADNVQPGSSLAALNTAATTSDLSTIVRLRMNTSVSSKDLVANSQQFKLQYSTSTSGPWSDVQAWCNTVTPDCTTSWQSRKKITFTNATALEELTDFPVLISLTSSNIDYSKTQNSGQDIRFTDSDGTALNYEIEKWDEAATSLVWVRVPKIEPNNTDYIWMYYNNSGASTGSNATNTNAVWDNANFEGVWHLKEDPTGSAPQFSDSTVNVFHGTSTGSQIAGDQQAAKIGGGLNFDGTNDYVDIGDKAGLFFSGSFTAEAWAKLDTLNSNRIILNDAISTGATNTFTLQVSSANQASCWWENPNATFPKANSTTVIATATWYHLACVWDGTTRYLYVNGVLEGTNSTAQARTDNSGNTVIGRAGSANAQYWDGLIDEARISGTSRTASWLKAEVDNVNGSFTTIGSEENRGWMFKNNATPTDGTQVTTNLLASSESKETYEENNPTATNPAAVTAGQEGEWDFALDPAYGTMDTTYYFRMLRNDGTAYGTYTRYPQLTPTTPSNPTYNQVNYRFGSGTSNNISYTSAPNENTALTVSSTGQDFRLRMAINVGTATLSQSGQTFKLRFGEKPAGGCGSATYSDVSTSSGVIRYVDIGGLADGDDISLVSGDPNYTGTERYQEYEESNNFTNAVSSIASGENGVWDFSLENNSSVGGKTYCFKITKSDGTALDTYTQYPEVIIDEELTFSLDATSKSFGTITPGASASDATSTLTTTTNASGGYQITLFATQLLTSGSNTIANWTGTNGTPTTLSGTGTSAFGYTTNDSNLGGGTATRFTSASNLYAGFASSGPGDIVADNTSTPVTSDAFTVTYRLRTGSVQQAGTYTTTLVYINTGTY